MNCVTKKGISLIPIKDKNFQNYLDFPVIISEKKGRACKLFI